MPLPAPPPPAGSLRLLVAEDEPHIRRILVTLLEASGFRIDVATTGREALTMLEGQIRYDMVITDLLMPEATGLQVLEAVRKNPSRRNTPVVILTAKGQDTDREQAFALGVDDFVMKPFSPKKLLNRVDQILGQR
ncbi:MAG: response regulator [Gemmatimonadales bacterium]|nr:MAG: response regulator [Gemmatimonadales bacterium]